MNSRKAAPGQGRGRAGGSGRWSNGDKVDGGDSIQVAKSRLISRMELRHEGEGGIENGLKPDTRGTGGPGWQVNFTSCQESPGRSMDTRPGPSSRLGKRQKPGPGRGQQYDTGDFGTAEPKLSRAKLGTKRANLWTGVSAVTKQPADHGLIP